MLLLLRRRRRFHLGSELPLSSSSSNWTKSNADRLLPSHVQGDLAETALPQAHHLTTVTLKKKKMCTSCTSLRCLTNNNMLLGVLLRSTWKMLTTSSLLSSLRTERERISGSRNTMYGTATGEHAKNGENGKPACSAAGAMVRQYITYDSYFSTTYRTRRI